MIRVNPISAMLWWLIWVIPLWIGFRMYLSDGGQVWERTEKIDANNRLVRAQADIRGTYRRNYKFAEIDRSRNT